MKNIFQNKSIKKAAAAGMIAAQVSVGSNFLSDSFVDTSFAEGGFYNSYNSSIFEELTLSEINPVQTLQEKTRCVLDSDNDLKVKPRVYSVDSLTGSLQDFKLFGDLANKIDYTSSPSVDGLYAGTATSTFAFGPNYNSDVTISVNMTSPNPGTINQLTPDSFEYISNPSPSFDYATGTYSATNGLGDTVNGVVVYDNFIGTKRVLSLNTEYNATSSFLITESNPLTDVQQNPANGTIVNIPGSFFNIYYYVPNNNFVGQDFFSIRDVDFYISVLGPTNLNGFEGGNFALSVGTFGYYNLNNLPIGTSRFYKPKVVSIPFSGDFLYKLEAPTTTLSLPQLFFNGSSTSFFIDTISSFYNDLFKTPTLEFNKQFTVVVEHDNRAPVVIPTAPANFIISGATGTVTLTSDLKDLEGDIFDLTYDISNDNFSPTSLIVFSTTTSILSPGVNSTSSNSVSFEGLPIGNYSYRVIATEVNSTQNCIGYSNVSGLKIASSTPVFKNFTVSNLIVSPTSTPTSTPPVVPSAPVAPQGGLLPLIVISPVPTLVASTTAPTTTEIKVPVKEVLGLNPEDSDDLLPGETPAAYLIRMEKRRVLGRSGSRDLLVETGYNSTLKIFAGVTLLAGVMLLINNRKEKKSKLV